MTACPTNLRKNGADENVHQTRPAVPSGLTQIGDYRIIREIGRGGMGVVYEAEQISLGRRVALKVLPGQVSDDPKVLDRFRRDVKAAARLHHTNIVPVFEVGQDGPTAFYAMQFISGQGLDKVIQELRRRVPERRLAGNSQTRKGAGGAECGEMTLPIIGSATVILRRRGLKHVAESLLSGKLGTEELEVPAAPLRRHGSCPDRTA